MSIKSDSVNRKSKLKTALDPVPCFQVEIESKPQSFFSLKFKRDKAETMLEEFIE